MAKTKRTLIGRIKATVGKNCPTGFVNHYKEEVVPTSKYIPAGENKNISESNR